MMKALLTILACIPTQALLGFVVSKLWGWFLVPLHAPAITWSQAAGISIITMILRGVKQSKNDALEDTVYDMTVYITWMMLMFGFGYVLHLLGGS